MIPSRTLTPGRSESKAAGITLAGLAVLAFLPLVVPRDDVLNFVVLILRFVALAAGLAIGTLALGEILRITIGNALPEISTLPAATIGTYRLAARYYGALALAVVSVIVVAAMAASKLGLGMQAVREDEDAAEASGVSALGLKTRALATSTTLAGLCGGLFAYYHVSYTRSTRSVRKGVPRPPVGRLPRAGLRCAVHRDRAAAAGGPGGGGGPGPGRVRPGNAGTLRESTLDRSAARTLTSRGEARFAAAPRGPASRISPGRWCRGRRSGRWRG